MGGRGRQSQQQQGSDTMSGLSLGSTPGISAAPSRPSAGISAAMTPPSEDNLQQQQQQQLRPSQAQTQAILMQSAGQVGSGSLPPTQMYYSDSVTTSVTSSAAQVSSHSVCSAGHGVKPILVFFWGLIGRLN